jgi:ring-1,2-phenylacetyl-CoA epoxidase subunit PaaE
LRVAHISPEAGGAVAVSLAIPAALLGTFTFQPGQYLTLRATIKGVDVRRSYSICSTPHHLENKHQLVVGIRPVQGGVFSNWAAQTLQAGDTLAVMPPQGRFVSRRPRALHRVGWAAGSGITPILSIMASTLEAQPASRFTLIYGNRSMASVMFNEALQDLKDRYLDRLTLIHILSRQTLDADLLEGRIDAAKVRTLIKQLLPVASMDEVFICGPEAMMDATQAALLAAGVPAHHVHSERFASPASETRPPAACPPPEANAHAPALGAVKLTVVLDGKPHHLQMGKDQRVLDVALAAGLDLPYSCKGGVCCTCRVKVTVGSVQMDKNFGLAAWETEKGFVLSCQARPTSDTVVVSFDER